MKVVVSLRHEEAKFHLIQLLPSLEISILGQRRLLPYLLAQEHSGRCLYLNSQQGCFLQFQHQLTIT